MMLNVAHAPQRPSLRSPRKPRSRSISQILREAYRRHTKEKLTLLAVKRYLG
jgi:hypothetical protein